MTPEAHHDPPGADRQVGDPADVRGRFDAMPLMLMGLEGPELRVVAANDVARTFLGLGEPVGRRFADLMPQYDGQQIVEMWQRVVATGEQQVGREWRVLVDPADDGELRESFVDFVVAPQVGPDGTTVGANGYAIDVTEQVRRRQAEQERTAAAERRYERARDVIAVLQESLLPAGLPGFPVSTSPPRTSWPSRTRRPAVTGSTWSSHRTAGWR